ncbi:vacuolar sorting protein 39 domain 2-domain-containing protein [Gilbertella persicaria]|uniref:vacuolar sorting protein 39 domain 2-domain-containing protein n=1 Tax=Gilbertella persicaria TaxID=101096 RepID=UPI00221FBE8C|nr:vacuolar sorting protein 39 domain 2-domain-containing protein [Gilbertella persicaria]KAI8067712.1 vacuolar sorting protein 39 domain 2-domain-containing protein [Gilbertella persicaria]
MALGKTKGANLFAIQTMVEMSPEEQVPVLTTRLAVAVRKKLLVFVWKDTEFFETKELNLPDRIKAMSWVGTTKICLGFSTEYALMDVEQGQLTELFAPTGVEVGPMSTLNSLYNMSIGVRGGKPMITKIPNNEMLLARDHVSIFLGLDGTPTRKVGIEWSGAPEQIGYSYPYVIAILPKHVEVRNIQTLTLVQQIELSNTKFLNQGKLVYVASTSQIYRLTPFSFSSQIDQLVEKQEYKEAVSLLDQIDAVLVENKEKKLTTIRTAYAHDLFRVGEYDTALDLFQELNTPAAEVISLYPEMISGHLAKKTQEDIEEEDEEQDVSSRKHEEDPRPPSRASTKSRATILSHQSQPKRKETVPLTGLNLRDAVTYLIRYLTDKRQKLARKLNGSASSHKAASDSSTLETNSHDEEDLLYQATLVDTSLLKSYMMTNDALVGPLLRVQNHCDVEECENILMDKKKYKELVDLYNCKGLHARALDLLEKLGKQSEGPLRGVLPTIRYLQKLGLDHFDLVLQYSRWALEKDPKHGMDIFIDDLAEVETFPRDRVLQHLESISGDLAIHYLEYVIEELHDESPEFHNRLVIAYLDKITKDKTIVQDKEKKSNLRSRLISFLTDSVFYKAEKILSRLPIDDLFEERAILLSRIGQHDQALDIYVYKLKNYAMAEEYCTKVFQEDPVRGEKMYLTLLKVYLQPSNNQKPLTEPALDLLAHHGSHIDASQVLAIMPTSTKLFGLFPFFEKYIRESNKNRNMDLIVKNLLKAEQIQVEEQLMFYRSRAVKITEDRMCPQCNKRIGNSVFAVFPNGVVVHYSCKEKIEQTQWKIL